MFRHLSRIYHIILTFSLASIIFIVLKYFDFIVFGLLKNNTTYFWIYALDYASIDIVYDNEGMIIMRNLIALRKSLLPFIVC